MKKIIIGVVIVLIAVGSVDPYANHLVETGFSEKNPKQCLSGASIKQKLFKYRSAISVYKKVIKKFPKFNELDRAYYNMAYCYEKDDNASRAIQTYEEFLSKYPASQFAKIAKKKLSNLKANSETDDI